jgi:hypothetical protein
MTETRRLIACRLPQPLFTCGATSSAAACAIVSIVAPPRYPLIAGDYPKMATWDTMIKGKVIARQGHEERATIADA